MSTNQARQRLLLLRHNATSRAALSGKTMLACSVFCKLLLLYIMILPWEENTDPINSIPGYIHVTNTYTYTDYRTTTTTIRFSSSSRVCQFFFKRLLIEIHICDNFIIFNYIEEKFVI